MPKRVEIRPQPGPQEAFLSTVADIAVYGGAAGGGKSWGLLFEPLRHIENRRFGAVIFRRTHPEIKNTGGLWDESVELYGKLGASPSVSDLSWQFRSGATVKFGHMQYETDLLKWHSAAIAYIGFDELNTFTQRQFFYMLTRNRSMCGIEPYMRATCNPDADSWVATLLAWWIDQDTGFPIPERSGVVRWLGRDGEAFVWGDTADEVKRKAPKTDPKSFTFIPAKLEDNQELLRKNPKYASNLLMQNSVDSARLLSGNWKVRQGGKYFDRRRVNLIPVVPVGTVAVRYIDTAASAGVASADTACVLVGKTPAGRFVICDCTSGNWTPADRDRMIHQVVTADRQRPGVTIRSTWIERPSGFGSESTDAIIRGLAGFHVQADPVNSSSGAKEDRWKPLASQWEVGNVDVVEGEWTEGYLATMDAAPNGKVDVCDASAGGLNKLAASGGGGWIATGRPVEQPRRGY